MQIDITEYLSKEEIKDIFVESVRDHITGLTRDELYKILSNTAYELVFKKVDEHLKNTHGVSLETHLSNKVFELIVNLNSFNVFRASKDFAGHINKSYGQVKLDEAVEKNLDTLNATIKKLFEGFEDRDFIYDLFGGDFEIQIHRKERK